MLSGLQLEASQAAITRALRTCEAKFVEVRLLLSGPSNATWSRNVPAHDLGAYEIRRVKHDENITNISSKHEWEQKTLYIVRMCDSILMKE